MDHKRQEQAANQKTTRLLVKDVVRGSYAEDLGIQAGDTIVSFNGEPIANASSLLRGLALHRDQNVELWLLRKNHRVLINAPARPLALELVEIVTIPRARSSEHLLLILMLLLAGMGIVVVFVQQSV